MSALTFTVTDTANISSITPKSQHAINQPSTFEQSLEHVRGLILVAVSSITELRNLLPSSSFEDRDIHNISKDVIAISDDGTNMNSSTSMKSSPTRPAVKRFRIISRPSSQATEKIYKWFDGIFHGISQQYIDSIQMSIIAEKNKPKHVLESYLFSILYVPDSNGQQHHVDINLTSTLNVKQVTVRKARSSFYSLMNHLSTLLRTLPDLPETRFLTFDLFFTDKRPEGWHPIGFVTSQSGTMLCPDQEQWKMQIASPGLANLGPHTVDMKVARLVALEPEIQNESTTHQIPVQLEFNKLISRRTFSFLPDDNSVLQTSNTSPIMPGSSPLSTPLTRSQVSSSTHLLSSKDHDSQNSNMLDPLQILEPRDTQDPDTASIQERLRQMARSQSINALLTQTQEQMMVSAIEPNWRLIASKNHELFKKREVFLKHINLIGSEIIRCPCGIKATEGSMMLCDCCDEWHHAHCYALDTRNSGFLGEAHACYSCLLGPSESDTHVKLEDVARLRRICWIVQSAGLSIMDKDLVKRSKYEAKDTMMLVKALGDVGIMTVTKDRVSLDEAAAKASFERGTLLHPLSHISQFYEPVSSQTSDGKPSKVKKRCLDDDENAETTDTQDLDIISVSKKKKPANLLRTPRRKSVLPASSYSPLDVRDAVESS